MFCTTSDTSETEGEVGAVKMLNLLPPPHKLITGRSKAVVLLWFSGACFCVRESVKFHLMCVYIIFISVSVAEWLPFGK